MILVSLGCVNSGGFIFWGWLGMVLWGDWLVFGRRCMNVFNCTSIGWCERGEFDCIGD